MNLIGTAGTTKLFGSLGLLAAIGAGAGLLQHKNFNFTSPEWLAVGSAFSSSFGALNARPHKVTSEAAGAPATTP